jgi:hypothetical protein
MLNAINNGLAADPNPADPVDIESELTELEGVAVALKIVRHGSGIFSDLRHDSSAYQHALFTMVDTVLDQIEKLSTAYRGEGHDDPDEEEDSPEARKAKAALGISQLTKEDVASMSPHGRKVISSHCERLLAAVDEVETAAPCP